MINFELPPMHRRMVSYSLISLFALFGIVAVMIGVSGLVGFALGIDGDNQDHMGMFVLSTIAVSLGAWTPVLVWARGKVRCEVCSRSAFVFLWAMNYDFVQGGWLTTFPQACTHCGASFTDAGRA